MNEILLKDVLGAGDDVVVRDTGSWLEFTPAANIITEKYEHDAQTAFFNWVEWVSLMGDYAELYSAFAIPNGGHRHKAVAKRMKAEGVRAGVADICLPFPSVCDGNQYHAAYIEMKVGRNKLTKEQRDFLARMRDCGNFVAVCYGSIAAIAAAQFYLGIYDLGVSDC